MRGKPDIKYRSAFRIILCKDAAVVLVDDIMGDGEAQSGSGVFGCNEGIKNPGQDFRVDSGTGVPYGEKDFLLLRQAAGLNGEASAGLHYLHCVEKEVQHHLP